MSDVFRTIPLEEAAPHVIQALNELKLDNEAVVRQVLAEVIIELSVIFKEKGGYEKILMELLPIVSSLTTDSNHQVRQSTMDSLVKISNLLAHEDIQPYLLPIVKSLVRDTTEEDHRVAGAQLLNDLAPIMKSKLCVDFTIPLIRQLASDDIFRVRKVSIHMQRFNSRTSRWHPIWATSVK